MPDESKIMTQSVQTRAHTLEECRLIFNAILGTIYDSWDEPNEPLHCCKLKNEYTGINSNFTINQEFNCGVDNI